MALILRDLTGAVEAWLAGWLAASPTLFHEIIYRPTGGFIGICIHVEATQLNQFFRGSGSDHPIG